MKKFLLSLCVPLLVIGGCNKFDPSELWDSINSLEQRVTALEELCKKMNTNIDALQALVSAIENRDYITNVTPINSQDKIIGYTVSFAKGKPITIYNGKDGNDGNTPVIGVRQDSDGVYYWTVDGDWLLDEGGRKVAAQGASGGETAIMPKLKIENDKWYVSYNNGSSWTELGPAIGPQGPAGEKGDSFFQSVEYTSTSVIFVLSDGTRLTVPRMEQSGQEDIFDKPANCYIVSKAGKYQFKAVKGNGSESVGEVASAEVIWETFGTDVQPSKGDLIASVSYNGGNIQFDTNPEYKKGNALIAAKDASGAILWSWHIWFTDKPIDHVYNNGAGTMMDRNLGATSATAGDVCAIGLCYQWGRKDPFLSTSSTDEAILPLSTLSSWPAAVNCQKHTGTIEYSIANPTTFIKGDETTSDWTFGELSSIDVNRWNPTKTIYDPCPAGYRVPDGGDNGIWAKAFGTKNSVDVESDNINKGINFGSSSKFTPLTNSEATCWYPYTGSIFFESGLLSYDGKQGYYWSVTDAASPYYSSACDFCLYQKDASPSLLHVRSYGLYVRCQKE